MKVAAVFFGGIVLSGCQLASIMDGGGVTISGPQQTSDRTTGAFTALEVHSAIHVIAEPGNGPITVTAPKDLLPLLRTRVENGTLIVDYSKSVNVRGEVLVKIHTNDLKSISATGASTVEVKELSNHPLSVEANGASTVITQSITDLHAIVSGASTVKIAKVNGNLDAELTGASSLKIDGKGEKAKVSAYGASHADLRDFATDATTVDLSGASLIKCQTKTVQGQASGASTVSAPGAKTSVETSGASSVQG